MDYEVKADTPIEGDALDAALDAADLPRAPMARPPLARARIADPATSAFIEGYIRRGTEVELKSVTGVTPQDGGFAVPREIDQQIGTLLKMASPMRQIATVVKVGTAGYRKLVTQNGVLSGWVTETAGRPETGSPQFNEIVPSWGELYANPAVTQAMLEDAAFDVENWLASEIATEFAKAEGTAFLTGNGVGRPRGFLTAPFTINSDPNRPFGTLQYVPTGAAASFGTNPQDRLIELVHALRAPYRQGAVWLMNTQTLSAIRKFKSNDGSFLFQQGMVAGAPSTLLGYPVVEAPDMPDISQGGNAIAFGNFKLGYVIAERAEITLLRDPYTNKPFVHFYACKRVGGTVVNSEAIKLLRFAAA